MPHYSSNQSKANRTMSSRRRKSKYDDYSSESEYSSSSGSRSTISDSYSESESGSSSGSDSYDDRRRSKKPPKPKMGNLYKSRLATQAALALQKRKKESPALRAELEKNAVLEVDYTERPTELYTLIEKNAWREASSRAKIRPLETKTWVFKNDTKGKLMWKMLPLHAAVLYKAPVYVVLDLLEVNPNSAMEPDDRKMLALHMACRILSASDVVRALYKANPLSINAKDDKGRTPIDLLRSFEVDSRLDYSEQKLQSKSNKRLLDILLDYEENEQRSKMDNEDMDDSVSSPSDPSVDSHAEQEKSKANTKSRRNLPPAAPRHNNRSYSKPRYDKRDDYDDNRSRTSRARSTRSKYGSSSSSRRRDRSRSYSSSSEEDNRSRRSRTSRHSKYDDRRRSSSRARSRSRARDDDDNYSRSARNRSRSRARNDDDNYSRTSRRTRGTSVSSRARSTRGSSRPPPSRRHEDDIDERHSDSASDSRSERSYHSRRSSRRHGCSRSPSCSSDEERSLSEKENHAVDDEKDELDVLWKAVKEKQTLSEYEEAFNENNNEQESEMMKEKARRDYVHKTYDAPPELIRILEIMLPSDNAKAESLYADEKLPSGSHSRRMNACGTLKAIAKSDKNRLRMARTKGVMTAICHVLHDPESSSEERTRCSSTLLSLCTPSQNWQALMKMDEGVLNAIARSLDDENSQVQYFGAVSLFCLSRSDENKYELYSDAILLTALVNLVNKFSSVRKTVSPEEEREVDSSNAIPGICRSPSNILGQVTVVQPTNDEESKLSARSNGLKAVLSMAKCKEVAYKMARYPPIMMMLLNLSGTLTEEENLLIIATFTNLTRHKDSTDYLLNQTPGFSDALMTALQSNEVEHQKCACFAWQNLSCNELIRKSIASRPGLLSQLAKLAFVKSVEPMQIASLHTIKNLSLEPCNIIPITNASGATATLMALANDKSQPMVQYIACDTLATLSSILRGSAESCMESYNFDKSKLCSLKVRTWNQWS